MEGGREQRSTALDVTLDVMWLYQQDHFVAMMYPLITLYTRTMLYNAIQCYTMLYNAIQYSFQYGIEHTPCMHTSSSTLLAGGARGLVCGIRPGGCGSSGHIGSSGR